MNQKNLFLRVLPATFLIGTLFGVGVGQLGASFKGSAVFRDVPADSFADEAIGEMVQLGIIKGLDSAHFGPNEPVTRAQLAVLFQRLRNEMKGTVSVARSSSSVRSSRSSSVAGVSSSSSSAVAGSSASSSSVSSVSSSYNPGGSVRFDVNQYNVDKNTSAGLVTIIVVRTGGNSGGGTVDYSFSGGTAVAGKNYQPIAGTLTFGSKETSKKLTMQILNDTTTSGTKTVNLVLRNAKGSISLGTPNADILNINDPNVPSSASTVVASSASSVAAATMLTLSASAYAVAENGTSLTITVNRTGDTTTSVGVSYATADNSARAGADYTATSGSFTFASGETGKSFVVSVANNNVIDGSRAFKVVLSSPTGGAGIGTSSAPVTINDDEAVPMGSGSLKFSSATYTESMGRGFATITVNHILGVRPVTVGYSTNGGSATQGIDYTAVSGTLTFAANEVSKTFTVPLINNPKSTGGKTVNLTITGPSNGVTLVDLSNAILTIDQ